MGTGIVAVSLAQDGREALSTVLLVIAGCVWVGAALLLVARVCASPGAPREAGPLALTSVAASAVVGASLAERGYAATAAALLGIALALWLALIVPALRRWDRPTSAAALMLPVATQSLAVLCAQLGGIEHVRWLVAAALALFTAGVALYAFAIARFALRDVVVARGEHWVAGGALAISSLAAARIVLAAQRLAFIGGIVGALKVVLAVLWIGSIAWLPVLIGAEILRPRLRYDARRWSTVFPAGMYAACSFETGAALGAAAIADFARVWVWVGFAVWAVTSVGALARMRAVASPASTAS